MITPEQFDSWRVVPRILVAMYGLMVWQICAWFMALPEPNGAQATFVSVVVGAAGAWFGFYVKSGGKE